MGGPGERKKEPVLERPDGLITPNSYLPESKYYLKIIIIYIYSIPLYRNQEITISKTAAIPTRPFDSATAPLKEAHFVSLFLTLILKKVNRQKLSRLSVAKRNAWRDLFIRLLYQYEVNLDVGISKTAAIPTRPLHSIRKAHSSRGSHFVSFFSLIF